MKKICLMCGVPGSGKSTLVNEIKDETTTVINADSIRKWLYGDENIQGDGKMVFYHVFEQFTRALKSDYIKTIIVDNTNTTFKARKNFYKLIKEHCQDDYKIELFFFTNFILAKSRNLNRDRVVPDDVMERMINQFQMPNEWEEYNCKINYVK